MRHSRLPSLVACLVAALATLLAPLLVASPAHAGDDPDAGRPEVGSCHDLTLKEGGQESDADDAVPCRRGHTTLTIAVPNKPAGDSWGSDALYDWSVTRCQRELISFFGAKHTAGLARSAYSLLFFYPTKKQRAKGATWVRCDTVLLGGQQLVRLPSKPRLDRSSTRCLLQRGDSFFHTVCARPHTFRSIATVKSGQRTYPSERGWARLAGRCPRSFDRYTYPSQQVFRAGSVYLTCYQQTRR